MKKKILVLTITTIMAISIVACGDNNSDQELTNDQQTESSEIRESDFSEEYEPQLAKESFKGFSFIYDTSWRIRLSEDETFMYLYPTDNNSDGFVMLNYSEKTLTDEASNIADYADGIINSENITEVSNNYETEISGKYARRVTCTQSVNDTDCIFDSYIIPNDDKGILYIGLCTPKASTADYTNGFYKILYTINYTGGIDYPDRHINNVAERFEDDIAYYDIYLTYSDDWNSLSHKDQCSMAEKCIEYCTDRAALYDIYQNSINIFAYNSNGETVFSYDGGNEVKFYTDGKYDFNYYL